MATARSHAGETVGTHTPSLAAAYPGLVYEDNDPARFDGLDLVFCGLPHGESQLIVPELRPRVGLVVDLAADFRLKDAALYPHWYGEEHSAPELLAEAVYGLPELFREGLAGATLVAAAGCYPTSAGLALAPLVRAGLLEPAGIVVDAASGVSGAGRGLRDSLHFGTVDEDFTAYGLLTHRHTPEMEQIIGGRCSSRRISHRWCAASSPPVTPGPRPVRPPTTGSVMAALHEAYDAEPFVVVTDAPPSTKATAGANAAHVTARVDPRTGWVLSLCALDNLVKGASGQAIQCANAALGPPRDHRAADSPGSTRERQRTRGASSPSGVCRHQGGQGTRRRRVATADGRAVPAAGVFTTTWPPPHPSR